MISYFSVSISLRRRFNEDKSQHGMRTGTCLLCRRGNPAGWYLLLGKGEEATGGRGRNSIVPDAMEALIGAIYLDGGFANAKSLFAVYYE